MGSVLECPNEGAGALYYSVERVCCVLMGGVCYVIMATPIHPPDFHLQMAGLTLLSAI